MVSNPNIQFNANMRGAAFMCLSCIAFAMSNGFMKLLIFELPPFQLLFLRGCIVTTLCLGLCYWEKSLFHRYSLKEHGLVFLRSISEAGIALLFFQALAMMPIFVLLAILQAVPICMTCVGFVIFKEKVGIRRWSATCAGFVGVLMIIRPGLDGIGLETLLGVGAMFGVVLRDTITRLIPKHVPASFVGLSSAWLLTLISGGICLSGALWVPFGNGAHTFFTKISSGEIPLGEVLSHAAGDLQFEILLVLGSVSIFATYLCSIKATRTGDIGFVFPFRYTIMVWAALISIFVFDDDFDPVTVLGVVIVVLSGLYIFWREQTLKITRPRGTPDP